MLKQKIAQEDGQEMPAEENRQEVREKSVKYFGFPPEGHGAYTIGLESIGNIVDEIRVLHQEHWDETEVLYKVRPMNPDYDTMVSYEASRRFILFTVRDADNKLVGDLGYYLGLSTHHAGMLQAKEDFFFLTKDHRGGGTARHLLRYAEKCLVQCGVKLIGMTDKSPCGGKSLKPFLEGEGYTTVAMYYMKEVD